MSDFIDPLTGDLLDEDRAADRAIDYQVEREVVADQLDALVSEWQETDDSDLLGEISALRNELDGYDYALDVLQEQFESADDFGELGDYVDWDDYDPELDAELDEWEFGVSYGEDS